MLNWPQMGKAKVVVVMPAYNAEKTLHMTYAELPHDIVDLVILVDDGSSDETLRIARELKLEVFVHDRNYGYGANQKTCYREALRAGAGIVVMVHPDYQYDPTLLPQIIQPIEDGTADVVLGSRYVPGGKTVNWPAHRQLISRSGNLYVRLALGMPLRDATCGYRAYRTPILSKIDNLLVGTLAAN